MKQKGVDFASVQDGFDTSSASGKMVFSVIGAMAEYERNLMREQTMAGLSAARARGRMGGRPKALAESQVRVVIALAEVWRADDQRSLRAGWVLALYLLSAGCATTEGTGSSRATTARPKRLCCTRRSGHRKDKARAKLELSYVCKRQPSAGGIVHAFADQIGPSNWRRPALCGAKPSSQKS